MNSAFIKKKKTNNPINKFENQKIQGKFCKVLETRAKKIQLVLLLFQLVNSAIDNKEGKHLTVVKNTDNFVALTTTQNIK